MKLKKLCSQFFIIFHFFITFADSINLEENIQEFVLETKRIIIPEYPDAFNPSIVAWDDNSYLLSFRIMPDPKKKFDSLIGVVFLDKDFTIKSTPQILNLREYHPTIPSRAEDARLMKIQDTTYIIYSDNTECKISRGGFRVYIATLLYDPDLNKLTPENIEILSNFDGESKEKREKNWTPFVYNNNLLLSYSLTPHKILLPIFGQNRCETLALSNANLNWKWGELRGGTPAVLIDNERYFSIFHSSINMETTHSEGKNISHYFMGAYTFTKDFPFTITHISENPIIGKNFYEGLTYKPYWKPVKAIFPCGIIVEGDNIFVTYGRDDHEMWVVKLDKHLLLKNLKIVENN
ncbi:hypothetical protein BN1013_01153 [Candidatus Rubidus massiliensis]|nr:hypothetical protein BN1013_01153 [Candidatus Rubidus massiliensis]